MVDYREILRLDNLGYTKKDIASSVHSSRNTVSEVLTLAGNLHVCWPLDDDVTNQSFVHWAEGIGTHTLKTVNHFLYSEKEPEQGYKYCVGLMKAAEKYGDSRIERACEKLLTITVQPSLRSIITILKNGQDKLISDSASSGQTCRKRSNGITRGISAYRNGGEAE